MDNIDTVLERLVRKAKSLLETGDPDARRKIVRTSLELQRMLAEG